MLGFELWQLVSPGSGVHLGTYWGIDALENMVASTRLGPEKLEVAILENGISSLYWEETRFVPLAQFRVEFAGLYEDYGYEVCDGGLDVCSPEA